LAPDKQSEHFSRQMERSRLQQELTGSATATKDIIDELVPILGTPFPMKTFWTNFILILCQMSILKQQI
jgi:hypothetical protein